MDREILFRGKRIDNGEWVYGLLCQYHEGISAKIALNDFGAFDIGMAYCVDPVTVGQYTGLTDCNGDRIFDGDIVKWHREDILLAGIYMGYGYVSNGYKYGDKLIVRCLESGFMLCRRNDGLPDIPNGNGKIDNYTFWNYHRFLKIVGNIHDNPELLEET